MDFDHARAGRIALGADKNGNPMLLWAEGAGKRRYVKGEDSCGASLREMAQLCAAVGMVNAVNLDGGGSAQILVNNRRHLHISDRNDDNSDAERPVPLGLAVQL
jgi:exopolysaccharide biosynthesis protein